MRLRAWSVALAGFAAACSAAAAAEPAWVALAPGGGSVARLLTTAPRCPDLVVDGAPRPMAERAAPAVLPPRTNKAGLTGQLTFASRVCEAALPRTTRRASIQGQDLPLPSTRIDRIVVIGDTGCRLKDADAAWQACNDPRRWPFATIARRAAALHPDLVLHVGDYLYRENPCPADRTGCTGAVSGYGEASWRADFLDPAAPLLAAAPWIMVRGNHEECARAGEGWWRFLDPHESLPRQDCRAPADDAVGNRAAPYAVELGRGARIVVGDLVGLANEKSLDGEAIAAYRGDVERIAALAGASRHGIVATHYPLAAVAWKGRKQEAVVIGSKPFEPLLPLALGGVRLAIAGHVHEFQAARFADRPTQLITGFSGTEEDPAPAPATLAEAAGLPGSVGLRSLTTFQGVFGYGLLVRHGASWTMTAYDQAGRVLGTFPGL